MRNSAEDLKHFNEKLKAVRNYKQLISVINEAGRLDYDLYMKRRRTRAFDFTESLRNPNKVDYLIDDGVSTGYCRYENLHRVMHFRL